MCVASHVVVDTGLMYATLMKELATLLTLLLTKNIAFATMMYHTVSGRAFDLSLLGRIFKAS